EANPERTCFPAGQGVGAFREIKPAADVLRDIVSAAAAPAPNPISMTCTIFSCPASSAVRGGMNAAPTLGGPTTAAGDHSAGVASPLLRSSSALYAPGCANGLRRATIRETAHA